MKERANIHWHGNRYEVPITVLEKYIVEREDTPEVYTIENEIILLKNIYDHIDEMVNFLLLDIQEESPRCNVIFHDNNQQKLFFILLVDFFSKIDSRGPIKSETFLSSLVNILEEPQFSVGGSETELIDVVSEFRDWLKKEKNIDVWIPSINREESLSITRLDMIKLCGNLSKHNYLRAIGVASDLQKIVENSGLEITIEQTLLILPFFYERIHDDVLSYLSSWICEFLNNMRLAIRSYLLPEFKRCYVKEIKDGVVKYCYDVPDSIRSAYAKECYWELMNKLRKGPCMEKFIVSDNFKRDFY